MIKEQVILNEAIELITKYETFTASVVGAVLASVMGILASVFLECRRNNRERKKYRKLIKYEISSILQQVELLKLDEQRIIKTGKLVVSNSWIIAKDYLHNMFSAEEINAIDRLFVLANEYDRLNSTFSEVKCIDENAFDWNFDYIKSLLFNSETEHIYRIVGKVISKL